jgi:hypothetical protein
LANPFFSRVNKLFALLFACQVFAFVERHSFSSELVTQYQEFAENSARRVSELTPDS